MGAGGRGPDMRDGGQRPVNPNTRFYSFILFTGERKEVSKKLTFHNSIETV